MSAEIIHVDFTMFNKKQEQEPEPVELYVPGYNPYWRMREYQPHDDLSPTFQILLGISAALGLALFAVLIVTFAGAIS